MKHYLPMTERFTSDTSPGTFTGRDVLYRERGVSALEVRRAADALLRRGQKPSIASVREQLGGGSPNTLAPLLDLYWKELGSRVAAGPDALERVPESLARMTEALWLRSIDEARQRAKASLAGTTPSERDRLALECKVTELTAALAVERARTSELESQLLASIQDGRELRTQVRELTALLKAEQAMRAHDKGQGASARRDLLSPQKVVRAPHRRRPAGMPLRPLAPLPAKSRKVGKAKPAANASLERRAPRPAESRKRDASSRARPTRR